jgi:hypothetical protein
MLVVEEEVGLGMMAFHFLEQKAGCSVLLRHPLQTYKHIMYISQ